MYSFPDLEPVCCSCPILTVASWSAYRFLRKQVRWSGIPISLRIFPQLVVIYTVKGFGIVNKAGIDIFLELSCFFYDPVDVGNLISGSSAFSKPILYIWKFLVHILLKPSLKDFEHHLTSMENECSHAVVWTLGTALLWDWNENWPFPVLWPLLVSKFADIIECSTSTALSFRILNCSDGIPSYPLALFMVILPKGHLTPHSRSLALGQWAHHHDYMFH